MSHEDEDDDDEDEDILQDEVSCFALLDFTPPPPFAFPDAPKVMVKHEPTRLPAVASASLRLNCPVSSAVGTSSAVASDCSR